MRRTWFWLQLVIGWLPIWALYTTLIVSSHPGLHPAHAALIALRAVVAAATLGLVVFRLTKRFPWPRPIRPGFLLLHLLAAPFFAATWILLTSAIESALQGAIVVVRPPTGFIPYLILGVWLYVMVAGIAYATQATERAARAEALAARSQLAALRAQLHPHFLFNALHTVVQLIPREPARARQAAEQLAGLLRTTIEEDRDLVPLEDEVAFVERYLEIERIRFGDRLRVRVEIEAAAARALVPAFAVQTLVENAVRHGAAPRIEATEIAVTGRVVGDRLEVTVHDSGAGATAAAVAAAGGTGLARLRERLAGLYGTAVGLELVPGAEGFTARLRLPREAP